jgi:hypothetical protein
MIRTVWLTLICLSGLGVLAAQFGTDTYAILNKLKINRKLLAVGRARIGEGGNCGITRAKHRKRS